MQVKTLSRSQQKHQKRRNAIEAIIGHLKNEHRMDRNYLLVQEGDKINALMAGCGFNLRKLILHLFKLFYFLSRLEQLPVVKKLLRMF